MNKEMDRLRRQIEDLKTENFRLRQDHEADLQKIRETVLHQSEEQYRSIFENAIEGFFQSSPDGRFIRINKALAAMCGYDSREEMISAIRDIGEQHYECKQDRELFSALLNEKNVVENFEHKARRKDGSTFWVSVSARAVRDEANRIRYYEGSHVDITERKQAEERLRETERKYRELAESLPQVIFEIDSKGRLIYLNHTGFELFGYAAADLEKGFNALEAFGPEERERVARDIMTSVGGRRLGRQEYTAVKKDGTPFPVAVHANRVTQDQTVHGIRGILIDLAPIRRVEEEKKRLEIQLQQAQKMEAIGSLAGGIAHDFNNILSAIIGYTELAALNEGAEHYAAELKEVLSAANRAKELVKRILAFSRQTDEERMPVRVALVTREALKFLQATIPATIEIRSRIDDRSGSVLANSVEIHQIIMNLCTNAQHAMGGTAGVLEVEVQDVEVDAFQKKDLIELQLGAHVRLLVKDTGSGMTSEVLNRIFDPYFTTKEKGVGTGLGLAVVHGIVKKYGGAIRVESELTKGTMFHVYLPKADSAAHMASELPVSIKGGSERILFVDDEKMLADVGRQSLQRLGYEVVSRTSPIEALELFKAKPDHFHLVITDQTMPGMTGDVLARELMRLRPGLPVIICTGYSQTVDQKKAMQIGVKAFVMKPLLISELSAAVRKSLGRES